MSNNIPVSHSEHNYFRAIVRKQLVDQTTFLRSVQARPKSRTDLTTNNYTSSTLIKTLLSTLCPYFQIKLEANLRLALNLTQYFLLFVSQTKVQLLSVWIWRWVALNMTMKATLLRWTQWLRLWLTMIKSTTTRTIKKTLTKAKMLFSMKNLGKLSKPRVLKTLRVLTYAKPTSSARVLPSGICSKPSRLESKPSRSSQSMVLTSKSNS